jgi:D-psicose/D-tagatose/L-ribulose 3-epimerase
MTSKNLSMNIAVSNLAWDSEDNESILKILQEFGIHQIEGVITKICKWEDLTDDIIINFKNNLLSNNIKIKSLQSIFYGTDITNLENKDKVIAHVNKLIEISKLLGVNVLVFGSPNLRKKIDGYESKLKSIFTKIDDLLEGTNIELSIEPNSQQYGGEFFFTVSEIVLFIKNNNFKNIKTMIDTHNIVLENENPILLFDLYYSYINHIHISEKKLLPFNDSELHREFSKKIQEKNYSKTITYEVLKCENFTESLSKFSKIYTIN